MARNPAIRQPNKARTRWWHALPEKLGVAVATAAATTLVTVAGPPLGDWLYAQINETSGLTAEQVSFQQTRWLSNPTCANSQPVWHNTQGGRQIDATICPGTGHILVAMRDTLGKQIQWWPNLKDVEQQFGGGPMPQGISALLESSAYASSMKAPASARPAFAQNVLCQMLLPDKRGLRRRLVVGPNQCVEVIVDTFTGQVVAQRPVPCNPNCAVNA